MKEILFENILFRQTLYEGYYVSEYGEVLSVRTRGYTDMYRYEKPIILKLKTDKDGYEEACLSITVEEKQKRIYKRVHRLVYETFKGKIPHGMTIDHIDNNKANNHISNLQILSRGENTAKANRRRKKK